MTRTTPPLALLSILLLGAALSGCLTAEDDPEPATVGTGDDTDATGGSGNSTSDGTTGGSGADTESGSNNTTTAGSPPTASIQATIANNTAPANVTFELSGSDPDGDSLTWTLDWNGDGTIDDNGTTLPQTLTRTFTAAGNFSAKLVVTDKDGSSNATTVVEIVAAPLGDGMCHRPDAIEVPGAGLWLDDRGEGSIWVYQESNGVAGLQVGGEGALSAEEDQYASCANPDTLIF